jgi:hypothetical protein
MSILWVLLPLFVEVALTFVLLFWSGAKRVASVRAREVHIRDIALRQAAWPPRVTQLGNAYESQFELPVLFYLLVVLAIFTGKASLIFVVLAWLFVAMRVGHALVLVTHNHVPTRFRWFLGGATVLLVMWLLFAAQVALGL